MSEIRLQKTLNDLGVPNYVATTEERLLARLVASEMVKVIEQQSPERLSRIAFVYESEGLNVYQRWVAMLDNSELLDDSRASFQKSFVCWRAISTLDMTGGDGTVSDVPISPTGLDIFKAFISEDLAPAELQLAFRIAVTGILANRIAETRLELTRFDIQAVNPDSSWRDRVVHSLLAAIVRLIRKSGGWNDIDEALYLIDELRSLQKEFEDGYIDGIEDKGLQALSAVELVGLYHLAQILTLTGSYLQDGDPPITSVRRQLNAQRDRAKNALDAAKSSDLSYLSTILWAGCFETIQNAIWTHVSSTGTDIQNFARLLADRGKPKPVIELWPSQQQAFGKQLFDPTRRAILVEMPTSAGKTLLAKFLIVRTKTINPDGTIAYVVPTRALVNQITRDLRYDFKELTQPRLKVEQAVPVFELDPTEEELLKTRPDILVTTPEKLDLLIKSDHEAVRNLSFIIADEAHNIADGGRGARLELLLGTIKHERPDARFLMLSPFLPNGDELVRWLGEDRYLPPIKVDWKPSLKMLGTILPKGSKVKRKLYFHTLPAANNVIKDDIEFPIGPAVGLTNMSFKNVTIASIPAFEDRGSILVLCRGRGTSEDYAADIAKSRPKIQLNSKVESICRYLEAEFGTNAPLVDQIRHGVAYHHSGLSHEARWLIESLISDGIIKIICGTTTLAQGMNFPITTVLITTLDKGTEELTHNDFWNIAGRAGRALVDSLGLVGFPIRNKKDRQTRVTFLKKDAEKISSQISKLFDEAGNLVEDFLFDMGDVRKYPELAALLQFLAHAMRVSGTSAIADELEDWLRSSLIFYQTEKESREAAVKLINLCRAYLASKYSNLNLATLGDQTGFTTPSVLTLLARTNDMKSEFRDPEKWLPERLFGDDIIPMRDRIQAIADLPEIELGQGRETEFNPELVAKIIKDWVLGKSLNDLANQYWMNQESDDTKRLMKFSKYLFGLVSKVSWGFGALETVSLSNAKNINEDVEHIPSMIFYGVSRKESIWLRMVGVPRIVADGLSETWRQKQTQAPQNYDDIRDWVGNLSDTEWLSVIPTTTKLTPEDMRVVWSEFSG